VPADPVTEVPPPEGPAAPVEAPPMPPPPVDAPPLARIESLSTVPLASSSPLRLWIEPRLLLSEDDPLIPMLVFPRLSSRAPYDEPRPKPSTDMPPSELPLPTTRVSPIMPPPEPETRPHLFFVMVPPKPLPQAPAVQPPSLSLEMLIRVPPTLMSTLLPRPRSLLLGSKFRNRLTVALVFATSVRGKLR